MLKQLSTVAALAVSLAAPAGFAACLDTDSEHPECRFPKGDAWCAKRTEQRPHAYLGECLEDASKMDLEGRAPFNWFGLAELDDGLRERIDLGAFDQPDQVGFALIRLGEDTPADATDALLVYRFDRAWCGSGGCDLRIYSPPNRVRARGSSTRGLRRTSQANDGALPWGIQPGQPISTLQDKSFVENRHCQPSIPSLELPGRLQRMAQFLR